MTPKISARVLVALAVGFGCFAASWLAVNLIAGFDQDYASTIRATKTLLEHGNPYLSKNGGTSALAGTPAFYYPLPTALLLLPLVPLPVRLAGPIFAAIGGGLLAFGMTRRAWWPLLIFTSASALLSIVAANLSTLLTAAIVLPWLTWTGVFKPNIGLAILGFRPSWKSAAAMLGIAAASLLLLPEWPLDWIRNATSSRFHSAPWHVPGAILIVPLALLRWRRPEARLLAIMALVPSSPIVYEALPLFVIPNSPRQMIWLSALSGVAFLLNSRHTLYVDPEVFISVGQWSIVLLVYVPALFFVLRRPNAGETSEWLERSSRRLPHWLRGAPR